MSKRICLALDLVNDADLIHAYEQWHQPGKTPKEIINSIADEGVENMEIYRAGDRMFMIMDVADDFTPEAKAKADDINPHVQDWIKLMQPFQKPIPIAGEGGTWFEMKRVFKLIDHLKYYGKPE